MCSCNCVCFCVPKWLPPVTNCLFHVMSYRIHLKIEVTALIHKALCVCARAHTGGHANMGGTEPSSGQLWSPPAHRAPLHTGSSSRGWCQPEIDGLAREEGNLHSNTTRAKRRRLTSESETARVTDKAGAETLRSCRLVPVCPHRCPRPVRCQLHTEAERTRTAAGADSFGERTPPVSETEWVGL